MGKTSKASEVTLVGGGAEVLGGPHKLRSGENLKNPACGRQ